MNTKKTYLMLTIFSLLPFYCANGQYKNKVYLEYIERFKNEAINQQKKYKIPASITLSQGLLESGAGRGTLANKSNNHFGIKCHNMWKGEKVYHDDDEKGECFRKYDSPGQSYEDHSLFLTSRPRYSSLFELKQNDYHGWAVGLQRCGYATDKAYASKLIGIIETYELHKYDNAKNEKRKASSRKENRFIHTPYISSGLLYIEVHEGDDLKSIGKEFGIKVKKLASYNEIPKDFPLYDGMIIYLQKKNKYAEDEYDTHSVSEGESMHSISQKYGIKLSSLYKLNKKGKDYLPEEGDVLKLNK
ncbi:MAG: glucosaminidase domain-containing protein [Bacteroidales bacterium]